MAAIGATGKMKTPDASNFDEMVGQYDEIVEVKEFFELESGSGLKKILPFGAQSAGM